MTDNYSVSVEQIDSWDEYFFNMAKAVASRSKCWSRQIGAILVKDNVVISTGYNGPPRKVPTCDKRWTQDSNFSYKYSHLIAGRKIEKVCPRKIIGAKSGQLIELCPAAHAEENAIVSSARLGTVAVKDSKLFLTCGIPCSKCLVKIINAGISELICTSTDLYDDESKWLLSNSTIKIRKYNF